MNLDYNARNQLNARKGFLKWLKISDPNFYSQTMIRIDANKTGGIAGFWDDIKGTVTDLLQTGIQLKQSSDLYKLQLQRAERGLPPLDARYVSPQIRTQIEIGPETRSQLFSEMGAGFMKLLLPMGIGLGVLFFMTRKKGK